MQGLLEAYWHSLEDPSNRDSFILLLYLKTDANQNIKPLFIYLFLRLFLDEQG